MPETKIENLRNFFSIRVYLNDINLLDSSNLRSLQITSELGGRLPTLEMSFFTYDRLTAITALMETSRIFIELASLDKDGKVTDKRQFSFFVMDSYLQGSPKPAQTGAEVFITATSDLVDKQSIISTPIKLNEASKSIDAIKTVFDMEADVFREGFTSPIIFKGGKVPPEWGSLTSKLDIQDMLAGRVNDKITRNLSNISKLDAINFLVGTAKLSNDQPIYHYFDCNPDGGGLDLVLFDLCTRCSSFEPEDVKLFGDTFKNQYALNKDEATMKEDIPAYNIDLDFRGVTHSTTYWDRPVDSFQTNDWFRHAENMDTSAMFPDGMDYPLEDVEISSKSDPTQFPVFRTGVLLKGEPELDLDMDKGSSNNRAIFMRYTRALYKVNYKITVPHFINPKLASICKIIYPNFFDPERPKEKLFSGKAMITKIIYKYDNNRLMTYLVASRDSLVKS